MFTAAWFVVKMFAGRALAFAQAIPAAAWRWIAIAAALAFFGWSCHSAGYKKSEAEHIASDAKAQKAVAEANAKALFAQAKAQADAIEAEAKRAAEFSASKAAFASKNKLLQSKLAAAQALAGRSPASCDSSPQVVSALNEMIRAANARANPKEAQK